MADITIAVDAMGGDYGPPVIVPAAINFLKQYPAVKIILVGDEKILKEQINQYRFPEANLQVHHASEIVGMDEPPAQALRFKKKSSMRVAINLVKEGLAQACVSAGNTGALMATARFVLKMLPGVDRPAISALLPTMDINTNVRVLDLGANVDATAEHLFQFAVMGSVLASAVSDIKKPAVGLLNIGSEEIKGTEAVKEAAKLLHDNKFINYIGYIEGDDIYKGVADVVVCDGFVGNVALKTSEGLAKMLNKYIKDAFGQNFLTRIISLAALPILKHLGRHLDPTRYNGASFVGLRATVIKSHGSANVLAFNNAIKEAMMEVQNEVPKRISTEVERILQETSV